jgi:hypothetical protein
VVVVVVVMTTMTMAEMESVPEKLVCLNHLLLLSADDCIQCCHESFKTDAVVPSLNVPTILVEM